MPPTYKTNPKEHAVTAEDLHLIKPAPNGAWYELDHGALVLCEPAGFEHTDIGTQLVIRLGSYVNEKRLGKVLGDSGTYVLSRNPDTVRIPDVSFVHSSRVPYGLLAKKFFEGYPDLAVEIMSPNDRFTTIERKVEEYLKAGTSLIWVIRPQDHTVIVRHKDRLSEQLTVHDTLCGDDVVPGFTCRIAELFCR